MWDLMYWLRPQFWSFEPLVLVPVVMTAALYLVGRSRRPRVVGGRTLRVSWKDAAFFAALASILVALDSPVDALSADLFWMHMTQHLILIVVAAPLLVASAPGLRIWRGLPLRVRRPVAWFVLRNRGFAPLRHVVEFVARPAPAFVLSTVALWFWHLPWAYDLTLENDTVHVLEHTLFFATGLLFWAQVIDQPPFRAPLTSLQRAGYVFAGAVQSWVLAGILAFAGSALYTYAGLSARPGGISALTDQVIGAGIMWVPGSITYTVVFAACVFRWLDEEDRKVAPVPQPSRRA